MKANQTLFTEDTNIVSEEPQADPVEEDGKLYVYPESLPPEKQKKTRRRVKESTQKRSNAAQPHHAQKPAQTQSQAEQQQTQQGQQPQPQSQQPPQNQQPVVQVPIQSLPNNQGQSQPQIVAVPMPTQPTEEQKKKESIASNKEKMEKLLEENDRDLLHVKGVVLPWDLFPDEIIIREHKVTIIQREFLSSGAIHSFEINELNEVAVETGPFLSKVVFTAKIFSQEDNHVEVRNLKRSDAMQVRTLLEGLTTMLENKIDLTQLDQDEIVRKAEQLGSVRSTV